MQQAVRVSPSILSADKAALGDEVAALDAAGADYIHIDVMDGDFVPNITFGPDIVASLRGRSTRTFDVHLMIRRLATHVPAFAKAGADIITVHAEADDHIHRALQLIRSHGCKAGLALNPATPVSVLDHVMADLDYILIMTVNPGFGGQAFIPAMVDKIRIVRHMIDERERTIDLAVDGGINPDTASRAVTAGADVLAAGTSVFTGGPGQYAENIQTLRGDA